jgi:hypothetical protein
MVRSAAIEEGAGPAALTCEKCGVELIVSTELGDDNAQLMLSAPPTRSDEACTTAKYRRVGDWAANMSKRWFRMMLLDPPAKDTEGQTGPEVSRLGLDIALDDAAHKLVTARQAESKGGLGEGYREAERLNGEVKDTVKVLDLVLVRRDSKTWQNEVDDRAALVEHREAAS